MLTEGGNSWLKMVEEVAPKYWKIISTLNVPVSNNPQILYYLVFLQLLYKGCKWPLVKNPRNYTSHFEDL